VCTNPKGIPLGGSARKGVRATGTAESLAQSIVATSYGDIPPAAHEQARKATNIAAAVIDGKIDLGTFTDKRADQGDIQALMARVRLTRNPDVTLRRPHIADGNPEARLLVKIRDG